MANVRKNDQSVRTPPCRSDRVFSKSSLWYFRTREGRDIGPFRYESEARQMLTQFVRDMMAMEAQSQRRVPKPHFRLSAIAETAERTISSMRVGI